MYERVAGLFKAIVMPVVVAVSLGGCSAFNKADPAPVDPNAYPSRYRNEVLQFMRTNFPYPIGIRDAYISEPMLKPVSTSSSRYVSCVRYNAKGAGGQYTGSKESVAIFFATQITQFLDATEGKCGGVNYQRFPELEALKL